MRGWGPVTSGLTSVDAAVSHWQLYGEGCREAGRVPDGADWRVVKYVHVAGTDAGCTGVAPANGKYVVTRQKTCLATFP